MLSYLLILRSEQTRVVINVPLGSHETEVVLGLQDELEENQEYMYAVTATNSIGNISSIVDGRNICE